MIKRLMDEHGGAEGEHLGITVSYRRDDYWAADTIRARLAKEFPEKSVFMDRWSITGGVDYRTAIEKALAKSAVVAVIIGKNWLGERKGGTPRLFDSKDPVRYEVAEALSKKAILVLPLLVDGAAMPGEEDLPDNLKELAFRQAEAIYSGPDFNVSFDRVARSIRDWELEQSEAKRLKDEHEAAEAEPLKDEHEAAEAEPLKDEHERDYSASPQTSASTTDEQAAPASFAGDQTSASAPRESPDHEVKPEPHPDPDESERKRRALLAAKAERMRLEAEEAERKRTVELKRSLPNLAPEANLLVSDNEEIHRQRLALVALVQSNIANEAEEARKERLATLSQSTSGVESSAVVETRDPIAPHEGARNRSTPRLFVVGATVLAVAVLLFLIPKLFTHPPVAEATAAPTYTAEPRHSHSPHPRSTESAGK